MYSVDFLPYFGAGRTNLDSTKDEIRKIIGPFKEFKKTKFSKNTTDDFSYFHVFYDEQNKVEAIEFFSSTEFLFKGKNLFSLQFIELKNFLRDLNYDIFEDESGLRSEDIGLSIYSPDKKDIETILIYRKGYYN